MDHKRMEMVVAAVLNGKAAGDTYPDTATVYYVTKAGDDTNGNGSKTNPWLTLQKAVAVCAGGETVRIGKGTYEENGYATGWYHNHNYTSSVLWRSDSGNPDDVIIHGSSYSYNTIIDANGNLHFRNVTFDQRATTNAQEVYIAQQAAHVFFYNCTFAQLAGAGNNTCVLIEPADAKTINDISFTNCRWTVGANSANYNAIQAIPIGVGGTGVCTNVSLINCEVYQTGFGGSFGAHFNGVTGLIMTGGKYSSRSSCAISLGLDGENGGLPTTGVLTGVTVNNVCSATGGHALLLGNGCVGCVVDGCTILPFLDYGLVLKCHDGTEVKNSTFYGAGYSAVYCKAATNANIHNNTLHGSGASGVFQLGKATTDKSGTVLFNHNTLYGTGTIGLFLWADDTGDSGGCVCDYNTYSALGAPKFGNVRAATDIATLTALKAAWAGYGDGSNDSHSTAI